MSVSANGYTTSYEALSIISILSPTLNWDLSILVLSLISAPNSSMSTVGAVL